MPPVAVGAAVELARQPPNEPQWPRPQPTSRPVGLRALSGGVGARGAGAQGGGRPMPASELGVVVGDGGAAAAAGVVAVGVTLAGVVVADCGCGASVGESLAATGGCGRELEGVHGDLSG